MTELSPEVYRAVLEALPTGVYLVDCNRRILLWSKGAEDLTGYRAHEVVGRGCHDDLLMHCDERAQCLCGQGCPLQETIHDGNPRTAEVFLLHKDGYRVPVTVHAVPFHDAHGAIIGAVECFDRRVIFPAAGRAVGQDSPASLLGEFLRTYETSGIPFGILVIAIASLDTVRHNKGSEAAHAVMETTRHTLAAALGPNDGVGRWGEERFLALVASCRADSLARVAASMNRLAGSMGIRWWGDPIPVTLSIGGAVVRAGDTPETLAGRASQALERSLLGQETVVIP